VAACCDVCRAPAVHLLCTRLRSLVLTLTTEESPPHRTIVHERRLSPNAASPTPSRLCAVCYTHIYPKNKRFRFFFLKSVLCGFLARPRPRAARRAHPHGRATPVRMPVRRGPQKAIEAHTTHRHATVSPQQNTRDSVHLCGELSPDNKYAKSFIKALRRRTWSIKRRDRESRDIALRYSVPKRIHR